MNPYTGVDQDKEKDYDKIYAESMDDSQYL